MIDVDESVIELMPEGFHGKFRMMVDGKLCTWFVQSLVDATKDLQVVEYPISELEEYLDINAWFHGEKKPTPRRLVEHWRRMEGVSLEHPIILSKEHGVMDGLHRLMKAYYLNQKTVRAVVFNICPEPDHIAP